MDGIPGLPPELARRAEKAAAWIAARKQAGDTVAVAHHIDADGLSAGAIAMECLERTGVEAVPLAARSLDDVHLTKIGEAVGGARDDAASEEPVRADALWFCDFGSTAYMHFPEVPRLVCDHHELVRDGTEEDFAHLNPLLDGLPGDSISGAGCAFLAAHAYDPANLDLLPLALVGATGDLQDRRPPAEGGASARPCGEAVGVGVGGFHGANAALLALGQEQGLVEAETDLAWFGPETRPLRKFLAFGKEPAVPGVTGDMRAAEAFLLGVGVPLSDGGERTWADLDPEEGTRVRSGLVRRLADCGLEDRVGGLWRQVVRITAESPGTPTRELQEYGTLLNSTARYGEPAIGLAVARGDRAAVFQEALGLRDGHRKNLVKSLDAFRDVGIEEAAAVQWVHLEDRVLDTVLGIVCGMALDGLGLRRDMPLVGFARTPEGDIKVSSRAPHEVQGRIDLATAMREASAAVGGQGGGHKGAAGASIPRGAEATFLAEVDRIVARQLGVAPAAVGSATVRAPGTGPGKAKEDPARGAETDAGAPTAVDGAAASHGAVRTMVPQASTDGPTADADDPVASKAGPTAGEGDPRSGADGPWRPRRGQNTLF